jgi:hypothetical protein
MWVGAEETVSKLALGGPSALDFLLRPFPGALPQAGMDRAFGALNPYLYSILSAEGALYTSLGRSPRNLATYRKRAVSPLNGRVLRQPFQPRRAGDAKHGRKVSGLKPRPTFTFVSSDFLERTSTRLRSALQFKREIQREIECGSAVGDPSDG